MNTLDFDHRRDRRSLKHRYAEVENEVRPMVEAAVQNELVTRGRVTTLEALSNRPFLGRFKWLLLGK